MKKGLVIIVILLFSFIVCNSGTIIDNRGPWVSSSGTTWLPGIANNVCMHSTGVGYTFFCDGTGICFEINGKTLIINHVDEPIQPCGLFVEVVPDSSN